MNNQITINTPLGKTASFLQEGFFTTIQPEAVLHKHNYGEIHVITGGKATLRAGTQDIEASSSDIIFIPGGMYHACLFADESCLHSAFQIDIAINRTKHITVGKDILDGFFSQLLKCKATGNYYVISSYIGLFCSLIDTESTLSAKPITDYRFLIHEFFTNNYASDIKLCDLARVLHLSSRQTERLVIEHTGNSFREELCQIRVTMAKELLKTTNMSLSEISRYVGYHSYAGFWKAMKKYEKQD